MKASQPTWVVKRICQWIGQSHKASLILIGSGIFRPPVAGVQFCLETFCLQLGAKSGLQQLYDVISCRLESCIPQHLFNCTPPTRHTNDRPSRCPHGPIRGSPHPLELGEKCLNAPTAIVELQLNEKTLWSFSTGGIGGGQWRFHSIQWWSRSIVPYISQVIGGSGLHSRASGKQPRNDLSGWLMNGKSAVDGDGTTFHDDRLGDSSWSQCMGSLQASMHCCCQAEQRTSIRQHQVPHRTQQTRMPQPSQ